MYPNPRADYEITSVFRIPKMGTIKHAISYSLPLIPRLSDLPLCRIQPHSYISMRAFGL
ncbi:MAG TPA: hypothetical protein VHV32_15635 [Candidatus Angelobacter sp.]|jgi:hypothetical protein|nr:hypothetical protein [Candidatus Angelobacter sp.]